MHVAMKFSYGGVNKMSVEYNEDAIKTMEIIMHMRAHPGMYDFDVHSQKGQYQFIKELVDNSADEAKMTPDKHHTIDITFLKGKKNYQVIINDMGRGVPLTKLADSFSKPGTSGKWNNAYKGSTGTYGMGSKATAALSKVFTAVSRRKDGMAVYTMEQGNSTQFEVDKKAKVKADEVGTIVLYQPDESIISGTDLFFNEKCGYELLHNLLEFIGVFKKNITFRIFFGNKFVSIDSMKGKPAEVNKVLTSVKRELVFESSVNMTPVQYLRRKAGIGSAILWQSPVLSKSMELNDETDVFGYDVELFITSDVGKKSAQFISAVNGTMISKTTAAQVEGLFGTIKNLLAPFIADQDQCEYFKSVYKLPIHAVIMAEYQNATFIGQGKNNFTDGNFRSLYVRHLEAQIKKLGIGFLQEIYDHIE